MDARGWCDTYLSQQLWAVRLLSQAGEQLAEGQGSGKSQDAACKALQVAETVSESSIHITFAVLFCQVTNVTISSMHGGNTAW